MPIARSRCSFKGSQSGEAVGPRLPFKVGLARSSQPCTWGVWFSAFRSCTTLVVPRGPTTVSQPPPPWKQLRRHVCGTTPMGAGPTTCEPQKLLHWKSQAQAMCLSSVHKLADASSPGIHRAHPSTESCCWDSALGGSMAALSPWLSLFPSQCPSVPASKRLLTSLCAMMNKP